jgi:hypothetical protein
VVGAVWDHDQHVNEFDDYRYIDHLDIDEHHIDDGANDALNGRNLRMTSGSRQYGRSSGWLEVPKRH